MATLKQRIEDLERQVRELQARPSLPPQFVIYALPPQPAAVPAPAWPNPNTTPWWPPQGPIVTCRGSEAIANLMFGHQQ